MSFLKLASPSRARIGRSASLPTAPPSENDSPPKIQEQKTTPPKRQEKKNNPPRHEYHKRGSLFPEWEQAAQAQLEIQALASSTLQAAATGCFYISPAHDKFNLLEPKLQSPASPNSPLLPVWDAQLNQFTHSPPDAYSSGESVPQIPKDDLVPGTLYSCTWWDSRNSGPLVRGRVEKFLFLDPLNLASRLHELSSFDPAFIEGGPHCLASSVDILWTMACNASIKGTVLPAPETGYCHICLEMGRADCYNPFHARELPEWWQRLREWWDGVFERARHDGRNIECMFFCGKLGCLNPVACQFRHDQKARRRICQETGRIRRRATFGSTWMAELGLNSLF